jgi:hypothetical protein
MRTVLLDDLKISNKSKNPTSEFVVAAISNNETFDH